ncbi:hypothetical protein FSS13T_22470 [Flavobacterium saliperosum S13]|uniref:histidine kinase n=2 Tax=Flavobacterium saliperosum TaxID=329186 RepID=A0A1G4VPC3_9FLAO|nr:PAS domain-containing protein [Flavobacterium saliperosum]ESU23939.1 hypothetical protein FSS13T_22470 [Flavobacterium saliperosum S13]SCX09788.1 PAS domain S-box-containing protein [Flavobacterium saliperosum]
MQKKNKIANNHEKDTSRTAFLLRQTEAIAKTGSWELDLQTQELYWSDGVYMILEFEPQSFTVDYDKGIEVIHPDDRDMAIREMNEAISRGKEYSIQKRFVTSTGTIKFIRSSGKVLFDATGQPHKLIGVFQDITDFVKAHQELQSVKSLVEVVATSVEGIIWEANATTFEFTYISKQVERILGYSPSDWLTKPYFWKDHIHPEDREAAIHFCHEQTLMGKDHTFEYRMLTKAGDYVWLQDRVTVISENGKPVILRGLLIDVSASKEIRKRLEDERNLNQQLIQYLPNVIFLFNEEGEFLLWNDKLLEMSGYVDADMEHLTPWNFFDSSQTETLIEHLQTVIHKGYTEIETEFVSKSGERKPMLFIASKFTYKGQKCIYGVGVDVSQRNQLIKEQKRLLKTIESILQFAPDSMLVLTSKLNLFKENSSFEKLVEEYAAKLHYEEDELKKLIVNQVIASMSNEGKTEITIPKKNK